MTSTMGIRAFRSQFQTVHFRDAAAAPFRSGATSHAVSPQRRNLASLATTPHQSTKNTTQRQSNSLLLLLAGGTALTASYFSSSTLRCEPSNQSARPYAEPHTPAVQGPGSSQRLARSSQLPPVESSVDLKSLSFGAVAGISTGIFIKKGLKAVGFLLGGAFVFLQYLASRGMVNVDWKSMASRYDRVVDGYAGTGAGSRAKRLGNRVVDFLLADFPPRATFVAGLALGLRVG